MVNFADLEHVEEKMFGIIVAKGTLAAFAASTARSLWKEMRREQLENTSKQSITEQYVSVGTPTASALRAAQAEDPEEILL